VKAATMNIKESRFVMLHMYIRKPSSEKLSFLQIISDTKH